MSDTLFVPIGIEAIVVNDMSRKAENFQRWQMVYANLESYASPMPDAFSGNTAINWNNNPDANGVYLHWQLPRALRTGSQDNVNGKTFYPLVPNRWLVVRYSGPLTARTLAAWVIESDYLDPNGGTSPYLDPRSPDTLAVTMIGRKLDLNGWTEKGGKNLFLTAVGTGDISFAAYQPYNENVFSIHDPLAGVTDPVLSYMVAGWYSDPASDILAPVTDAQSFLNILKKNNWQVDDAVNHPCSVSVYQGFCCGIHWDKTGPEPVSKRPETATVAVGNTSIDALTALIAQQAQGNESIDVDLLEAFQYNLLPVLDQPNGPDLLNQAIHKAWFGSHEGGYEWNIVDAPEDAANTGDTDDYPDTPIDWNDPNLEPAWLSALNQAQAAFDEGMRKLQFLQWNLYRMWWTKGRFDNTSPSDQKRLKFTDADFDKQLDVNNQGSKAWLVQQQATEVARLLSSIPYGATQAELAKSIAAFAADHQLPAGYVLKRFSKVPFFKANEPVVLVAGSKATIPLTDDDALTCRLASQFISGLTYNSKPVGAASMNGKIPVASLSGIPILPAAILTEFFFLDPNNATLIATVALGDSSPQTIEALTAQIETLKGMTGTVPALIQSTWQQPWSPMFLLWTAMYYPIAHDENGTQNWSFDGSEYVLSGKNMPETNPKDFILNGTTLLTPQSSFNFKNRLDEYRAKHPDLDAAELTALEDFITATDDWDFLSQTLDGFMQQLIARDNKSNVVPGATDATGKLVGHRNSIVPELGAVPEPFKGWPPSEFQAYRSGQFCFQRLMLVDRFGQALQLTSSDTYLQFKPVISPDMKPAHTVLEQEPYRFIELSPRILQPARLNFDFVSATDDSKIISLHSDANPVCAWVLPNHIDRALACYDPTGAYLGELRVITNDQAQRTVYWDFAPNSPYTSLDDLAKLFPHLVEMLNGLISKGPDAFNNFFQAIDETLWVIDPLGSRDDQNLSVLVGRPLALTRCRLKYQLDGPPVTDPSWQYTFTDYTPEVTQYVFPVRLGELRLRNDGLIGYFSGSDYSRFNCVHLPSGGSVVPVSPPYIVQIGVGNFIDLTFDDGSSSYVTMLIDPRASVHATTAILPITLLNLPAKFTEPALRNMDVHFRMGPVLSTTITVKSEGVADTVSVLIPQPSEKNGTWSWMEPDGTVNWNVYPIQPTSSDASFSNVPSRLRSGMLKLSGAMKQKS
jgi:hypothetical protein